MVAQCAAVCDGYRQARAGTLRLLDGLDQAVVDRRPAPGKWSPGEVCDHLLLSERYFAREIEELTNRAASGRGEVLERTFADFDGSILFLPRPMARLFALPLSIFHLMAPEVVRRTLLGVRLIPLQAPTFLEPRAGRELAELRAELAAMPGLTDLEATLDRHPDLEYHRLLIIHPALGRQPVPQLLEYAAIHEQRHQAQIHEAVGSGFRPGFAREGYRPT